MKQYDITGKEWLDLLFEHRNKSYGAYELRHQYGQRLWLAVGTGLSIAAILLFLMKDSKTRQQQVSLPPSKEMLIREYKLPEVKKIIPPVAEARPKSPVRKSSPVATRKFVNRIEIKKDQQVSTVTASVSELQEKEIGETDLKGTVANAATDPANPDTHETGNGKDKGQEPAGNFVAIEIAPEFPGGPAALHRFLATNLRTPDELEPGDKRLVKVKFTVNAEGFVSAFEILQSAGADLDKEVLRVCSKMPRWKPAEQNGTPVPVSFMVPVTFVGPE